MSIPNAALQKLLQEVELQAVQSQQQINAVKSQISVKQREQRLNQLTLSELSDLSKGTNVYEGVGKMFVAKSVSKVDMRLSKELQTLKSDIAALDKKLHYLETTHKNSREHIDKILQTGGRA